ncbi:RraA family protein [Rugosimonospora acidiphila]|uniref:Putative 4-hydroxy-4-methyl-2-oxoglutarate aldolase n=1 Tax=Rugosimonospora acidiphila TaxID=556531 RepID=A0ABP9SRL5_9ACTN
MSDAPADPQLARLARLDSCAVSDALDALGIDGVIPGLAPRWEGARAVGRAVTMQLAPGPTPEGQPKLHLGVRAIASARPGNVIVVANEGRLDMGSWGGLLSVGAIAQGVAGVVTDGACRDIDEARQLGFPVFARGGAARTARGRIHEKSCGEPIVIGSVRVCTGDLILADGTSVVAIAAARADEVLAAAEQIAAKESAMVEEIRAGATLASVLGVRYEDMLVKTAGEKHV